MRTFNVKILILVLVCFGALGCNAILGIEDKPLQISDKDPSSCKGGDCATCSADMSCPKGQRCRDGLCTSNVRTDAGMDSSIGDAALPEAGMSEAGPEAGMACATAQCAPEATCSEESGAAVCICPKGYSDPLADGRTCVDINECETGTAQCHALALCKNVLGGFECDCTPGFNGDGINACQANAVCTDAKGSNCSSVADCVAVEGINYCVCAVGYEGNGQVCDDVDECKSNNGGCAQTCTNSAGSFACSCNAGYTLAADGKACTNNNDCAPNPCQNGGSCADGVNSYTCTCAAGWQGTTCTQRTTGCSTAGTACSVGLGPCKRDGTWLCNSAGNSVTCSATAGTPPSSTDADCDNIDDDCSGAADEDFVPSCSSSGDITTCSNHQTVIKDCDQICTTSSGTPVCACTSGWTLNANGTRCDDVNECLVNNGGCDNTPKATCNNQVGAPNTCTCPAGYSGNGVGASGCIQCIAGTTDCTSATQVRTCSSDGLWGTAATCPAADPDCASVNGTEQCTGECVPTKQRCGEATKQPETCQSNGTWAQTLACNLPTQICLEGTTTAQCVTNTPYPLGYNSVDATWTNFQTDNGFGYLIPIVATKSALLRAFSVVGRTAGGFCRTVIYADDTATPGRPGKLVTYSTDDIVIGQGASAGTPVSSSRTLTAGKTYWIGGDCYATSGHVQLYQKGVSGTTFYSFSHTWGDPFPDPFPTSGVNRGQNLTLPFAVVVQTIP